MKNVKPFDTTKRPQTPSKLLALVEWIASAVYIIGAHGGKITKHNCEDLEAPYLLLSNHASMIDFPMAVKAIFPKLSNWVITIEEFIGRERILRGVGGMYKRKFTSDLAVVKNLLHVLKIQKRICVMYPEARYALAGINEKISDAIGKLVKKVGCPVVVMIEHGNFIRAPQWNAPHFNLVPVTADFTQVITKKDAEELSAEEIQRRIEDAMSYDDYKWQYEQKVRVKAKNRANNIHRILYQCPVCKEEFCMDSHHDTLLCKSCGASWHMDEYGRLHRDNGPDVFTHVPDWYNWERENVRTEVRGGRYHFEDSIRLEHLENCRIGFRTIGTVKLRHDYDGFTIYGTLDNGEDFYLNRTCRSMMSCHIEYDFHKRGVKKRGPAIDIATVNDTYFVFPLTKDNPLTKIHFATEELYELAEENQNKSVTA